MDRSRGRQCANAHRFEVADFERVAVREADSDAADCDVGGEWLYDSNEDAAVDEGIVANHCCPTIVSGRR